MELSYIKVMCNTIYIYFFFLIYISLEETNTIEEDHLKPDVLNIVKKAIVCAEEKNFDESFRLFHEALKQAPESPSILNDRAQALRLANRDEGTFTSKIATKLLLLQMTHRREAYFNYHISKLSFQKR